MSRLAYSQGDINLRLSGWDERTDVACVRTARAVRARDRLAAARAGDRVRDAPSPPRDCPCDLDLTSSVVPSEPRADDLHIPLSLLREGCVRGLLEHHPLAVRDPVAQGIL